MQQSNRLASIFISVMLLLSGTAAQAASPPPPSPLLIAEVQTGSASSTSEEFIELANVTDNDIDVSDIRVEYFSANTTSFDKPSRTILLHGVFTRQSRYLIASTGYLSDLLVNDNFSPGLSAAGGHLRIVNSVTKEIYDLVGWGTASHPENKAAEPASAGLSLQRKTTSDQQLVDTGNNYNDFLAAEPTPTGYTPPIIEPETPEPGPPEPLPDDDQSPEIPEPEPAPAPEPNPEPAPVSLIIQITELLPNPAAPQTDAQDEFIELYNPNDQVVSLSGYKLQTGLTFNHSYTFTDQAMAPFSYQAFYSSETGAALANTSGKARLVAPDGQIVSETAEYGTAADGQAWAWNGSSWQWTTSPSPSVVNTISAPTASKKSTAAKKTTAKKASSTKTTKPKVAKAKAVKGVKTTTPVLADTTDDGSGSGTGLQPWLLAGTGGLAVLYGAYEYRSDLANFLRKFRFYRRNRGESGAKS